MIDFFHFGNYRSIIGKANPCVEKRWLFQIGRRVRLWFTGMDLQAFNGLFLWDHLIQEPERRPYVPNRNETAFA
jgi:hypothetical protein